MPKYLPGQIQCTTEKLPNGRFRGKVIVSGLALNQKSDLIYLCPEIDDTSEDAMRRAIAYVDLKYPPE